MQPKWTGPTEVKQQLRPDSYIVQLPGSGEKWVHANRLGKYYARVNNVGVVFESDEEFGEFEPTPELKDDGRGVSVLLEESTHFSEGQVAELGHLLKRY